MAALVTGEGDQQTVQRSGAVLQELRGKTTKYRHKPATLWGVPASVHMHLLPVIEVIVVITPPTRDLGQTHFLLFSHSVISICAAAAVRRLLRVVSVVSLIFVVLGTCDRYSGSVTPG